MKQVQVVVCVVAGLAMCVACIAIVALLSKSKKNDAGLHRNPEDFGGAPQAPSKCYACERESPNLAYGTKCFDCVENRSDELRRPSNGRPRLFAGFSGSP